MSSLYVKKNVHTWAVIEEIWKNGKREKKMIPREAYPAFGIDPKWDVEEITKRIKQINKEKKLERSKIAASARRAEFEKVSEELLLEDHLTQSFLSILIDENLGGGHNQKRLQHHWSAVQTLIKELKIPPHEFGNRANSIYNYIRKNKFSVDYANRLIRILNLWGNHVCQYQNRHYRRIERPKNNARGAIKEAYLEKTNNRNGGSRPLTPKLLEDNKDSLSANNYKWLFSALHLGLRPLEVDNFRNKSLWEVVTDLNNVQILRVYQTKLRNVDERRRWKSIPLLYPEQLQALEYLKSGECARPAVKKLKSLFGPRFDTYCGRKGFFDMMIARGEDFDKVSSWMGHLTIDQSWTNYRDVSRVHYRKKTS